MKPDLIAVDKPPARTASRSFVADLVVLAKVRVNSLVVATTAAGYYMAAPADVDVRRLLLTGIGTALVASGAAAINQVRERDVDRLMERTRNRPLAEGRMSFAEGATAATIMAVLGLGTLLIGSTLTATIVALITLLLYAFVYTPLKRRTSLAIVIGAVPGALPPLIGWAAAGATLASIAPWTLFAIMFFWQLPHFLAIAWMCRDDYARAGMPMLSVIDPNGGFTGRQTMLWAAALIPLSQSPFLFGLTTAEYAVGALLLGIAQFIASVRFARHRSHANARALFLATIVYLPLLLGLMALARR
jgi:protoheme IX farnesyltransferase